MKHRINQNNSQYVDPLGGRGKNTHPHDLFKPLKTPLRAIGYYLLYIFLPMIIGFLIGIGYI